MELSVTGKRCELSTGGVSFAPAASPWPAVILIHGAAHDKDAWLTVARGLTASGCAVLAPDLPGHGQSEGPALGSIDALADWLAALVNAAGLDRAMLVGHSMGSLVALACAARYPQCVSRLALLGTSIPMPVAQPLLARSTDDPDAVRRLMTEYSASKRFLLAGSGGHGLWGPGITLAIMRRSPPGVLAIDLALCDGYHAGLDAATQVKCPTLLLTGRRDRMTPRRNLSPLQSALAEAQRVEIPDCGHAMMSEQPLAVVRELLSFLAAKP